jgi:UDP-N-acetylmuramyl tripeptide synthase
MDRLVLISGTNGKTTTTALAAAATRVEGTPVWTNATGSNLERGIAAEVVRCAAWHGGLGAASVTTGIFEVDEMALAALVPPVTPTVVVLLNLFRDQLDRFGEVDTTAERWRDVVARLPAETVVVANADDPLVTSVARTHVGPVFWFGTEEWSGAGQLDPWADVRNCPECGEPLIYDAVSYAHLGRYRCPRGDLVRPPLDVVIQSIEVRGVSGIKVALGHHDWCDEATLQMPGRYSAYNVAAAVATGVVIGLQPSRILATIGETGPSFGRAETIRTPDCELLLLLAKNPASANQVLDMLASEPEPLDILILLNDGIADGEDVSWIWDVDFERLQARRLTLGGRRAYELALRVKYAGVQSADGPINMGLGIAEPLDRATRLGDGRLAIIATYTAMLAVRDECVRRGWAKPYWQRDE